LPPPLFSGKGAIDWRGPKIFQKKDSDINSAELEKYDETQSEIGRGALSLAYCSDYDFLCAGFSSGFVRVYKFTPNFSAHTTILAKFRLEFLYKVDISIVGKH
ncbi:MAG: hypothetical protein EZS28_026363, partial [Streblomastix strix]